MPGCGEPCVKPFPAPPLRACSEAETSEGGDELRRPRPARMVLETQRRGLGHRPEGFSDKRPCSIREANLLPKHEAVQRMRMWPADAGHIKQRNGNPRRAGAPARGADGSGTSWRLAPALEGRVLPSEAIEDLADDLVFHIVNGLRVMVVRHHRRHKRHVGNSRQLA